MAEQKRSDDASDHAPRPGKGKDETRERKGENQDAPNYDKRVATAVPSRRRM